MSKVVRIVRTVVSIIFVAGYMVSVVCMSCVLSVMTRVSEWRASFRTVVEIYTSVPLSSAMYRES